MAMARSSDITEHTEAYEALASNATIWMYPAVCQNMRSMAVGMPALQMMANSNFAIPNWLSSVMNGSGVRLDPYYDAPWRTQNLVATITQILKSSLTLLKEQISDRLEELSVILDMSFSMHNHRYIYPNLGFGDGAYTNLEYPAEIQQIFSNNRLG